ncbi:MAG: glycine cleavage system protein H [Desulfobaccales bacterium]
MKTKVEQKGLGVRVLSMNENQCIWMKAGVVNFKTCENAFDCTSCAFDKAISKKSVQKPTALVSWKEVMGNPKLHKECRHMLTGRVIFKLCSHNFECKDCAYDQLLYDYDQLLCEEDLSAHSAAQVNKVAGFMVADGYYYHKGHSWARIEHGGFVRLGIDDFAWRLLGATDISLPKIGTKLKPNQTGWSIKREEMTAEILTPMSGIVMATNQSAVVQPNLSKKDPYGKGWLVVIDPVSGLRNKTRSLLFEQKAVSWLKDEVRKLEEMVVDVYGVPLAATGGEIVDDIFGNLHDLKWEDLVHKFLLT